MLGYSFLPTGHAHFCSSDLGGINALIAFAAVAAAAQAKPLAASLIDELHNNTQWQQQQQPQLQIQQQQLVRTASQLDL